ncbi:MAG: amidase [Microbacteriaceae bacterium]|nr:MAG: amidase [Microbacteriaceae bacterium]
MSITGPIEELTIADVHSAYRAGTFSAVDLVEAYLDRIETIDRSGAALNSIITISNHARQDAARLDAELAQTGEFVGPLHGVPIVVKDQIETAGIPTSFGSAASGDYTPKTDATAIRKLKAAGAIVLAKTTMPDFATSWFSTSSRSGVTKNPFDLTRDPGGSSSGTAAAVSANLALAGIGEDTGGSIRLPASFCGLVGVRVTPGLISRTGMSALVTPQDTSGPMTRTVADAALLLDTLVGFDIADPYTSAAVIGGIEGSYTDGLAEASLIGRRIGVLRQVFGDADDPDGQAENRVLDSALAALAADGAELIDVEIPDLDHYVAFTSQYLTRSLQDMNAFVAARTDLPVTSIQELHAAKKYHAMLDLLEAIATGPATPADDPDYLDRILAQSEFQRTVVAIMASNRLDAIAFPDSRLPAPTTEDVLGGRWTCLTYPTNTVIASQLLFPAVTVPIGLTAGGLPVGFELMSYPYDEASLLRLASAVERTVRGRRAPAVGGAA